MAAVLPKGSIAAFLMWRMIRLRWIMLFCFGERDILSQKLKNRESGLVLRWREEGIGEKTKPEIGKWGKWLSFKAMWRGNRRKN